MKSDLLVEYIREVVRGSMRGSRRFSVTPIQRYGVNIRPSGIDHLEEVDGAAELKAACVLIIADDGKVLAVSRKDDPTDFGLPGGKVDPGESYETAAARELKEETGLTVTDLKPVFEHQDEGRHNTVTFVGNVKGTINTGEAGVIRWVEPSVLLSCRYGSYMSKLFSKLNIDV